MVVFGEKCRKHLNLDRDPNSVGYESNCLALLEELTAKPSEEYNNEEYNNEEYNNEEYYNEEYYNEEYYNEEYNDNEEIQ